MERWRLYCIGMWICFLIAAIAATGEYLGWWRDFGEWLMWMATLPASASG